MIYYFPLWQGSGSEDAIYHGAGFLRESLVDKYEFTDISPFEIGASPRVNEIENYEVICKNLGAFQKTLEKDKPEKVLTLGGDCSLEIIPISYANQRYGGTIKVFWFDAHADVNTPQSSPSGTLHGMPVRVLLGEGDRRLVSMISHPLEPEQLFYVGIRDLDADEEEYVCGSDIPAMWMSKNIDINEKMRSLSLMSYDNVYVHIDLDVVDPKELPDVRIGVTGGISKRDLLGAVAAVTEGRNIVGGSIVEYTGERKEDAEFVSGLLARLRAT